MLPASQRVERDRGERGTGIVGKGERERVRGMAINRKWRERQRENYLTH